MSARPNFLATRPVTSLKSGVGNRSRREPEYLLLPVNPWFMWATLFAAMLLSMLPLGRVNWWPDLLAIALVFWNVHQPRRVGVGVAFAFGLIIDVHSGALLGQNALSYTALSFLAISMHRRIVWFSLGTQALHVLPLFIAAQLLEILVRIGLGGQWPGLGFFIAPFIEASLWPLVSLISLAPQRRPVNSDKNRPVL